VPNKDGAAAILGGHELDTAVSWSAGRDGELSREEESGEGSESEKDDKEFHRCGLGEKERRPHRICSVEGMASFDA
jgi:hypothetical protein